MRLCCLGQLYYPLNLAQLLRLDDRRRRRAGLRRREPAPGLGRPAKCSAPWTRMRCQSPEPAYTGPSGHRAVRPRPCRALTSSRPVFPCAAPDFDSASPQIKIVPLTFLCRHFYSFIQQLLLDYLDVARLLVGRRNTNVKTTRPLASRAFQPASVTSHPSPQPPPHFLLRRLQPPAALGPTPQCQAQLSFCPQASLTPHTWLAKK